MDSHVFLTTHSHVPIDLFARENDAQIIHLAIGSDGTRIQAIESTGSVHALLDDLGVRASDLLQANAVIWVEGPSDAVYVRKWIELWSDGEILDGAHYTCAFFGGSLGCYHKFVDNDGGYDQGDNDIPAIDPDALVKALRINRNAIFLADSDRKSESDDLKKHVLHIQKEVTDNGGIAWVTNGREIENYIPDPLLPTLLDPEKEVGTVDLPGQYGCVFKFLSECNGVKKATISGKKVKIAHKIAIQLTKEMLATKFDLRQRLDEVCKKLREWNGLAVTTPKTSRVSPTSESVP